MEGKYIIQTEISMTWYSLRQLCKELGMAVNTFKKHYIEQFPPDRESATYKGYTSDSVKRIKAQITGTK